MAVLESPLTSPLPLKTRAVVPTDVFVSPDVEQQGTALTAVLESMLLAPALSANTGIEVADGIGPGMPAEPVSQVVRRALPLSRGGISPSVGCGCGRRCWREHGIAGAWEGTAQVGQLN